MPAPDGSGTWLTYEFVWDDRFGGTGHTQLMFGLAPDGQLRGFRVAATDAFWSAPFDLANAGLAVARDALWDLARDKMKPADYQRLKSIMAGLDDPQAWDLLLVYLNFQMYTRGIF